MSKIFIELELDNCLGCPKCVAERHWTADSWEHAYDYYCGASSKKKIAGYVEWPSEMPPVPNWCPFKTKEK